MMDRALGENWASDSTYSRAFPLPPGLLDKFSALLSLTRFVAVTVPVNTPDEYTKLT